jgi:hypothetical protein
MATELVAEPLCLRGAVVGDRRLGPEPLHQPADNQGDHDLDAELDGDVLPAEALVEVTGPHPFEADEHRNARRGDQQSTADPVPERALDEHENHHLTDGRRRLVVEREDERRDDGEVEDQRREAEPPERGWAQILPGEIEHDDRPGCEHTRRHPDPGAL